ncbi:hypothetical protein A4D02_09040 [Niastella koreensis]|uniref:Amino acid adenylation domain protein n=2 Tax=Niastella koreensis TaxID=354356 RepID=G8TKK4_NIAKG|nr:non-ribosomal peptide synthetase [Niastella koreensis]AEV98678.1 amino acid adenylation domain protein [Niastella koreensis GR20-10]OQP44922.1 hypothetical protein A4D02_09040 [Niastella koreensis]
MKKLLADIRDNNILLEVVNGELKVFAESNPDPLLLAEIKKRKSDLLQILSGNSSVNPGGVPDLFIPLVAQSRDYVLSSAQRRLWVLNQLEPESSAYNLRGSHVFEGELNVAGLEFAFNSLIARHEILRTVFKINDHGEVRQYVLTPEASGTAIMYVDLCNYADQETQLNVSIHQAERTSFNLAEGPLLKATLYKMSDGKWVFSYVMHHIIGDAWSTGVLVRELMTIYNARIRNEVVPLTPLRIQYKDFAAWQQQQLAGSMAETNKTYWLKQFEGDIPVFNLATGKTRPAVKSNQGGVVRATINSRLTAAIKKLGGEEGATLFMTMLALVKTLLYRYTGQEDIVIGTSIASREHIELENQIGFYVNTLALRTRFNGQQNFKELLNKVGEVTMGAFAHQDFPFDELVDSLEPDRDRSRHPLFDVMVVLQNINLASNKTTEPRQLNKINVKEHRSIEHVVNKFDLTFFITDTGEQLLLRIVYDKDMYDAGLIQRMAGHLEQLIDAIITEPAAPLTGLDLLDAAETKQLLDDFGTSAVSYPAQHNIITIFEEQVAKTPDAIALVAGKAVLSYAGFNEKVNRLANFLKKEHGIGANDRVGIVLDRSEKLIIAMFGVLKAGGSYVVIEPDNPASRQAYITRDAGVKLLITQTDHLFNVSYYNGPVFAIDVQLDTLETSPHCETRIQPEHLAYLVYTSGTTGEPKGVMVTHSNVTDYHYGILNATNIGDCKTFGLVSTAAADLGNTVIYTSLLLGGMLQVYSADEVTNGKKMRQQKPDCIKIVPSHWKALQDSNDFFLPQKCLVFGGETLTGDIIEMVRAGQGACDVYNHYGPSETTIGKLIKKVAVHDKIERVPLGKPFGNTAIYVLDEHASLLPAGVAGEICISGRGLAQGYLNQPALTAQKFVANPFKKGELIYKTGDLGIWLPDGDMLFLGRKDSQVKIRGYRVELGEIEQALLACEGVTSVIVLARMIAESENVLVAYYTGKQAIDPDLLRTHLTNTLPAYMAPQHYQQIDHFPLTRNGKIDRKRLPAPEEPAVTNFIGPRNKTEEKLVEIWKEVLDRESVSVTDNFFAVGGHSLRAIRLVNLIHKTFQVTIGLKDIFATLVLEDQAKMIANSPRSLWAPIEPAAVSSSGYPLSSAQYRLWLLSQFEQANIGYVVPSSQVFEGPLDRNALEYAFKNVIERHEILRTVFREDQAGEVKQFVLAPEDASLNITFHDLRNEPQQEQKAQELVNAAYRRPFNLATGPLITACLIGLTDHKWVFSCVMHHLISDGWSRNILTKELLLFYNSYRNAGSASLPPLRIQYKDFAVWQRSQLSGEQMKAHKAYWLNAFEGELPVLDILTDRPRPARKTYNGAYSAKIISRQHADRLKALGKEGDSTLFISLLAAVNVLLYRHTGQEDIITGTLIAGRQHADLEDQIGFYVNTLPVRARFTGNDSFIDIQEQLRQHSLNAFEYEAYPFDELIQQLELQHDLSRNPLFDVCVSMQTPRKTAAHTGESQKGLSVSDYSLQNATSSRFDLSFEFVESGDELRAGLVYNTDLFNKSTAVRLLNHLEQLIIAVIKEPAKPVRLIEYISEAEKSQLLYEFNNTGVTYPGDKTVAALFREQTALTPGKTALIAGDISIDYKELDKQSDKLAVYLREKYGIKRGDFAGIMISRSEKLIIAILGILKAGAAYVPIDPAFPDERKDFILKDTGCKVLITQMEYAPDLHYFGGRLLEMDIEALMIAESDTIQYEDPCSTDVAYVMYTSGSSGTPKGVLVEHRSIVRLLKPDNFAGITQKDVLISTSAIAFDGTTFEYWSMLLNGGTLVLCEADELLDSKRLSALIKKQGVTVSWFTAGLLNQLVDENIAVFDGLHTIVAGGDKLSETHVRTLQQHYPALRIINGYGPTENTTFSTTYTLNPGDNVIPVGRPINNSFAYILDHYGQLCPVGVKGEIHVAGDGLARGYLNNEVLTAEKFIEDPFRKDGRMYRTGDLGCWLPDGNILFMGRKDDQVKINGFRVEPGEIENTVQRFPGIQSAVVIAKKIINEEKELTAYFVGEGEIDITELRTYLAKKLPAFMIPAYFIQLTEMPLTVNGKIDRKNLPEPEGIVLYGAENFVAPRNETEEKLAIIWQEITGRQRIGVKDNFFEVGGHSLRATRLVNLIHKTFEVSIALKDVFEMPVLEEQAALIQKARKNLFIPISPASMSASGYPLSASQYRLWILCQLGEVNIAYNVKDVRVFKGDLNSEALAYAFRSLIQRHEVLRTVFRTDENGEIKQFILSPDDVGFNMALHDVRGDSTAENRIKQLVKDNFTSSFDLAAGPLIRAGLIQRANQEWVFTCVTHHIISDAWSRSIQMQELMAFYNSYITGTAPALKPLRIQYKDFSVWQKEQLGTDLLREHKAYWLKHFEGVLPVLDIPTDKVRPVVKTYNGSSIKMVFSKELTDAISSLAKEQEATLFMALLAAVNGLLYIYTSQEDIIIGSPIAGREHADLEDQVGFYVNTLALRTRFEGTDTFRELLTNVRQVALGAYEHQIYPFDQLVTDLNLKHDRSRNPLFDVQVIVQNAGNAQKGAGKGKEPFTVGSYGEIGTISCVFDLVFNFEESPEGLQVRIAYDPDIYSEWLIKQLGNHLEQILDLIITHPDVPINRFDLLNEKDKQQLLSDFNKTATATDVIKEKTIISLFEEQVLRTPELTALVFGTTRLTYRQLNEKAGQLARFLKKNYHVEKNELMGVLLNRSEHMIISILGILKAGAAYVPVNPDYPRSRKDFVLKDTRIKVLITETTYLFDLDYYQGNVLAIDIPMPAAEDISPELQTGSNPEDLVYVIYTSGSSGEPKGVMVENRGLANTIQASQRVIAIPPGYKTLQLTSFSFDASAFEIFLSLASGAELHIVDDETRNDPAKLGQFITDHKIDWALIPPAYLRVLEIDRIKTLKKLVTAGEAALANKAREFLRYGEYYNAYGPTETSICATIMHVRDANLLKNDNIPIGCPIANSPVYIVNEGNKLAPVGVVGEICVGGAGLARGYLHKQSQTVEKFIPNPFVPGERMYKTGDLGRWLPDGVIEYIGRKDEQVKINGNRIEPGEIESVLMRFPQIEAAVVVPVQDKEGRNELVAYLVSFEPLSTADLVNHITRSLPAFMLPAKFVQVPHLPITSNGKIDKKALPDPYKSALSMGDNYIAPANETQRKLAMVWEQVLGLEQISVHDDYFELGGNSLKAMEIIKKIQDTMGCSIPLKVLFEEKTIESIARQITPGVLTAPSYNQLAYFSSWNRKGDHLIVLPYESDDIQIDVLTTAINQLVYRHEVLRTEFVRIKEDIKQRILPPGELSIQVEGPIPVGKEETLDTIILAEHDWEPDLFKAPLFRVRLYRFNNHRFAVLITIHHIISDGYSAAVIKNELTALYSAAARNKPMPEALTFQYRDFSEWQRSFVDSSAGLEHKKYWLQKLHDCIISTPFPNFTANNEGNKEDVNKLSLVLDGAFFESIDTFCKKNALTRTSLLLGVLMLLIHRITNKRDVAICTAVSGRNSRYYGEMDVTGLIGFFANLLIVRNEIKDAADILQHLKNVQSGFLDDLQHDAYPFDKLIDELANGRVEDLLKSAVFFNYHNFSDHTNAVYSGEAAESKKNGDIVTHFGLLFVAKEYKNCLKLNFIFNTTIFPYNQRTAIRNSFTALLQQALSA